MPKVNQKYKLVVLKGNLTSFPTKCIKFILIFFNLKLSNCDSLILQVNFSVSVT